MRKSKSVPSQLKLFLLKGRKCAMFLAIVFPVALKAQWQRIPTNGFWLCHYGTVDLTNRMSIVTETEIHTKEWTQRWTEQLFSVGISEKFGDKWRVAASMTWSRNPQYLDKFFFKNEWRPWQEVNYTLRGKLIFWQRLRNEERWIKQLNNGRKMASYDFVNRLRYRTDLQWPLGKGTVIATIANELMFNPGYTGSNRFLDQNRTWVGVNFKVSRTTILQTHYMKIFQWHPNYTLDDQNIFRVNIVQRFNQKG